MFDGFDIHDGVFTPGLFLSLQEQQRKGVIVATDCNFSMAVAHHAVELKIPVFVIMPSCCSSPRLRTYRDYGAMVISYGSTSYDSQNHARHLAKENGYLYLEESVPLRLGVRVKTKHGPQLVSGCKAQVLRGINSSNNIIIYSNAFEP